MFKIPTAAIIGALLGTLASRYLFVGSGLSLIPWTIAGLLLGKWSSNRKEAVWLGMVYGFFLLFVFMLTGYQGSAAVVTKLLPFVILGALGAVGGIIITEVGVSLRGRPKQEI